MPDQNRKFIYCKGTIPGTNKKCQNRLCETDGEYIYIRLESGRELIIEPLKNKGFGILCDNCGYKLFWFVSRTNG